VETGARAWKAARGMSDIQFAPVPDVPAPEAQPPEWLLAVIRFLAKLFEPLGKWLGQGWGAVEIVLIALTACAVLWLAWTLLWPLWRDRRRKAATVSDWAPERAAALALLEDADRLAAEGRFDEAARLLLTRSVHQIASARPQWLTPSSTAREISAIREMPTPAKQAFGEIAQVVERSLYALRSLAAEDWTKARAAYAEFALADLKVTA
jgi:hypothetical protein